MEVLKFAQVWQVHQYEPKIQDFGEVLAQKSWIHIGLHGRGYIYIYIYLFNYMMSFWILLYHQAATRSQATEIPGGSRVSHLRVAVPALCLESCSLKQALGSQRCSARGTAAAPGQVPQKQCKSMVDAMHCYAVAFCFPLFPWTCCLAADAQLMMLVLAVRWMHCYSSACSRSCRQRSSTKAPTRW